MKEYILNGEEKRKIFDAFGMIPNVTIYSLNTETMPESIDDWDVEERIKEIYKYKNKEGIRGLYLTGLKSSCIIMLGNIPLYHEMTHCVFYSQLCKFFNGKDFYELNKQDQTIWYVVDEFIAEYFSTRITKHSNTYAECKSKLKKGDQLNACKLPYYWGAQYFINDKELDENKWFKEYYDMFLNCIEFDNRTIKRIDKDGILKLFKIKNQG